VPQRRLATDRFLATVLFTDIVGSTERAAELGDRSWQALLERHHALVRRELRVFGGRERGTSGDGFFAVFDAPERAVRCAESITSAVATLGLQVRAGVHVGECEVVGGDLAGMAVHIGARIGALAGPGEVLVSGSVRDLMTGSDRRFEGGEQRTLKGVPDPWRVYRLVPEDVAGDVLAGRRQPLLPLYTRRQRRRLMVVIAGLLAAALALTTAGYLLTRSDPQVVAGENTVGVIGPGGVPRVSVAVGVGERPTAVASGFGSVWVTNSADDSVTRVDLRSSVPFPINLDPGSSPSGVAVGEGAVWVANSGNSTVAKIDPRTSRVTKIPVRPGPTGITVAFGSVWVTNAFDGKVSEIDPDTNKVVKEVPVGAGPTGIAAGAGYVWVTNQADGTVTRFNPSTYERDPAVTVGRGPVGIAFADGAAWVANSLDGSLSQIDAEDLSVDQRTLAKDGGAYGVAVRGGNVWVSNEHSGTLMRVTAETFLPDRTVPLRGAPLGLTFAGDDLWFTSAAGGSVLHRGGLLTMVAPELFHHEDPPVLDPLVRFDEQASRLAALTNDGLVGFRRAAGVQGAGIVPNLATSLPTPSKDGRTYTVHLREGVRYSTGAPVQAGDIRRGIERTVAHPENFLDYYSSAIVGAQACADAATKAAAAKKPRPDCDLRKGIVADDRAGTITFHLTRTTPEFAYQLALAGASAVPQDTPLDLKPGTFVPATGPYMIRSYTPMRDGDGHGRLEFVRNPHFHEWSPAAQPDGYPDRIVLETGYTDKESATRVIDGRADFLWFGAYAPEVNVSMLRARYGSQLHTTVGSGVYPLWLNTRRPPFDKLDARRAVAYVLDREAITTRDIFAGPVTCQLIPPEFAAYRPYCPFTLGGDDHGNWHGPDITAAQRFAEKSGTSGAKVVFTAMDNPFHKAVGRRVVRALRGLGYRASLQVVSPTAWPGKDWNIVVRGWGADYPAASQYLAALASCEPGVAQFNLSRYCDDALDKQIAAALDQQVTDPASASDAWALIDRKVVDAAAIIPIATGGDQQFVSRRVGNTRLHPILGPLIAQMWVE
jgi:peptide/nickel transport system substrate-binding protein